jgi:hypothetical protein
MSGPAGNGLSKIQVASGAAQTAIGFFQTPSSSDCGRHRRCRTVAALARPP